MKPRPEVKTWLRWYIQGKTLRWISEVHKIPLSTIRFNLNKVIPLRTRDATVVKLTKRHKKEVLSYFNTGWDIGEIAHQLNCSSKIVIDALMDVGAITDAKQAYLPRPVTYDYRTHDVDKEAKVQKDFPPTKVEVEPCPEKPAKTRSKRRIMRKAGDLQEDEVKSLVSKYNLGSSLEDLGKEFTLHTSDVKAVITSNGGTIRSKGRPKKSRKG